MRGNISSPLQKNNGKSLPQYTEMVATHAVVLSPEGRPWPLIPLILPCSAGDGSRLQGGLQGGGQLKSRPGVLL